MITVSPPQLTDAERESFCCFVPPENQEAVAAAVERARDTDTTAHAEVRALACQNKATWGLAYGPPSPDDATESCDEHVAALLGDSPLLGIKSLGEGLRTRDIDVVFGVGCGFQTETSDGETVVIGEYLKRDDGRWAIRIPVPVGWCVG